MAKATKEKKISLMFKKDFLLVDRKKYVKMMTQEINTLEGLGIEILNIHFSSMSESVYVSYKLDDYNEERMGLKGKIYAGHLAFSGHQRAFEGNTTTLYFGDATNFKNFFVMAGNHIESVLSSKDKVEENFSIIDKRTLTILQLMNHVTQCRKHFEIFNLAVDSTNVIDIMCLTNNKQPLFIISDEVSSDFYRQLRKASLLNILYKKGADTDRVNVTLSSLAMGMFAHYGSFPEQYVIDAFDERKTFDLWVKEDEEQEPEEPYVEPTEQELVELDMTLVEYAKYEEIFKEVTTEKSTLEKRKKWVSLLERFVSKWLPEEVESLGGNVDTKADFGKLHFTAEPTESEEIGAHFYTVALVEEGSKKTYWEHTKYIRVNTHNLVDLLQQLKEVSSNAKEIPEEIGTRCITATIVRAYLSMKRLERYSMPFAIDLRGIPSVVCMVKDNPEFVGTLPLEPVVNDMVDMVDFFSKVRAISKNDVAMRKSVKYHSNKLTDQFITYAQSVMPWVQGEMLSEEFSWIPLVLDSTKPIIRFSSVPDLLKV